MTWAGQISSEPTGFSWFITGPAKSTLQRTLKTSDKAMLD